MNNKGMNTAISERVSEITVKPISRAPRKAASSALSPFSMWRTIFSIMTIASSTTKPVPMVSAINDRLSSENPAEPHHAESRDQRQGQRNAGNNGGADSSQKNQDDEHH